MKARDEPRVGDRIGDRTDRAFSGGIGVEPHHRLAGVRLIAEKAALAEGHVHSAIGRPDTAYHRDAPGADQSGVSRPRQLRENAVANGRAEAVAGDEGVEPLAADDDTGGRRLDCIDPFAEAQVELRRLRRIEQRSTERATPDGDRRRAEPGGVRAVVHQAYGLAALVEHLEPVVTRPAATTASAESRALSARSCRWGPASGTRPRCGAVLPISSRTPRGKNPRALRARARARPPMPGAGDGNPGTIGFSACEIRADAGHLYDHLMIR